MRKFLVASAALVAVSVAGCNIASQLVGAPAGTKLTAGQLFCAVETAAGPLIVTVLDAAGVPFIVTGLASDAVAAACKSWNAAAVPVSPASTPVPSVAVPVAQPAVIKG